jgi:3-hydroxybutyryl-CoA dehydrogenase
MTKTFNAVGVVGAGTMGAGIAMVSALAGIKTVLYDLNTDVLQSAVARLQKTVEKGIEKKKLPADAAETLKAQLSSTSNLSEMAAGLDLVIEAVPEDMALKQKLLQSLDELCPPETCFASNTSSLSITAMASVTKRPENIAGMHFFNPVAQMKLVEIIAGQETCSELVQRLHTLAERIGKTPVIAKDTPGFIVNRVARSFYGEALRLLDEGVADVSTLDVIMRDEGGFAMGPFELMDLIGLDVNFAVTQSVYQACFQESRYKPHPIQQRMVEAGYLGRKTGKGFYTYATE